jgi:SAM-dependent methyltransferase
MLSYARRKGIAANFQLMDAARLPFHEEFDAAVISIALHEMPFHVRGDVWVSMRHAVRPKGRLIALDYAVPRQISLPARIAGSIIEHDERSLLTIHREHYENFQEFMRNGGLRAWIQERGEPLEKEYNFWGGTFALVICRLSKSAL